MNKKYVGVECKEISLLPLTDSKPICDDDPALSRDSPALSSLAVEAIVTLASPSQASEALKLIKKLKNKFSPVSCQIFFVCQQQRGDYKAAEWSTSLLHETFHKKTQ